MPGGGPGGRIRWSTPAPMETDQPEVRIARSAARSCAPHITTTSISAGSPASPGRGCRGRDRPPAAPAARPPPCSPRRLLVDSRMAIIAPASLRPAGRVSSVSGRSRTQARQSCRRVAARSVPSGSLRVEAEHALRPPEVELLLAGQHHARRCGRRRRPSPAAGACTSHQPAADRQHRGAEVEMDQHGGAEGGDQDQRRRHHILQRVVDRACPGVFILRIWTPSLALSASSSSRRRSSSVVTCGGSPAGPSAAQIECGGHEGAGIGLRRARR